MPSMSSPTSRRKPSGVSLRTMSGMRCCPGAVSWQNPPSLCSSSLSWFSQGRKGMCCSPPTARTTQSGCSRHIGQTWRLTDASRLTTASSRRWGLGPRTSSSQRPGWRSGPSVRDSHRVDHAMRPYVPTCCSSTTSTRTRTPRTPTSYRSGGNGGSRRSIRHALPPSRHWSYSAATS